MCDNAKHNSGCAGPSDCSALDFQSAPYEALCGCVAVMISESYGKMLDRVSEEDRRRLVKNLLDSSQGYRNVCANCPTCGGSGILPNMDLPITPNNKNTKKGETNEL